MLRKAVRGDEKVIFDLIYGLAVYEKEPHKVINSAEDLEKHLFDENCIDAILAVDVSTVQNEAGEEITIEKVVGFALYYNCYSTWRGKCLYLEDLFVLEDYRSKGFGSMLFDRVVEIAQETGCSRLDWVFVTWNTPAIEFYKRKGADIKLDWSIGQINFK